MLSYPIYRTPHENLKSNPLEAISSYFIEFLSIEILVVFPHAPYGMQQLAHDGGNGLPWFFACSYEFIIESLDVHLMPDGH